jgi:mannose-6-phosphate isomerase
MEICLLKNSIMDYPWGSHSAIPELLGKPSPSEKPQAELWMGTHAKAPSMVLLDSGSIPLPYLIEEKPAEMLGREAAERFNGKLPFLLKILAAAKPLSIQAHPSLQQAKEGYAGEQARGIAVDAADRNYRDQNHKPEIICALSSSFWSLKGFRPMDEIVSIWSSLECTELQAEIQYLQQEQNSTGLRAFFETLIRLRGNKKEAVLSNLLSRVEKLGDYREEKKWLSLLQEYYPGDSGILSILLLNLVELHPGEAVYTEAGELHAYLEGTGIELMANSDNVLRGGLTFKHIDIPELMRIVRFTPTGLRKLKPDLNSRDERVYKTPFNEFELSYLEVHDNNPYRSRKKRSIEIWINLTGNARIKAKGKTLHVRKGDSFLVPAGIPDYSISGNANLYRATIPL